MQHLNSLHDLFVHELRDLYDAEKQLVNALPEMAQAAIDTELREAFEHHLDQTRTHVNRLNTIFADLGMTAEGKECEAMKGLVKEGKEVINAQADSGVKDAALIAAAQRVEHYEIAGYGAARTYAEELGHGDIADLLQETLDEEGRTDDTLTGLATGGLLTWGINEEARAR